MKHWSVEVRLNNPDFPRRTSPLSWPVVEHKLCFTRWGARRWSQTHAGLGYHVRINHLGRIS